MDKNALKAAVALAVLIGAIAAYFYWQNNQSAPGAPLSVAPTQTPPALKPPVPETRQTLEAPTAKAQLPQLKESDSFVIEALAGLVGNKSLMKLFHTENIIHNIVATIDSLPRMKMPLKILPVLQPAGKFITSGSVDDLTISPKNAARYTSYVQLAEAVEPGKLVELYVRIYPLFQQAYRELGYPNDYFNDRLIEALDDLLDAPDIKEPVKLLQPHVLYQYADPDLEELSIGQRILVRTGSINESRLKAWLAGIKLELNRHMHDQKSGTVE